MKSSSPFNPKLAVQFGLFIEAAYQMHAAAPSSPTPAPAVIPSGYKFLAWVQMRDFVLASGAWAFYGFIAQNTSNQNEFILAIRGTSTLEEWWDDLTSLVPSPWPGPGLVGYGFKRIYETLRVVDASQSQALAATSLEASAASSSFAEQVAATLNHHAAHSALGEPDTELAAPPVKSLIVTGHSLGSALTTLYTMENASKREQVSAAAFPNVTDLYTFASPRVGNETFAEAFDNLPITSWRIVNELDIVPKLPPPILFTHIEPDYSVNSGNLTQWTLSCWHALTTYLHLLDPAQPLDPRCIVTGARIAAAAASASLRVEGVTKIVPAPALVAESLAKSLPEKELTVSVPGDKTTTINITINIGSSGKNDGHN